MLNQQYIAAVRTNDARWFEEHLAGEAVIVLGNGRRMGKPEFLAMLKNEPKSYRSLDCRNVTLRVFGAIAQVDADAIWQLSDGSTGVSRYIDTYAWLESRWQVISAQVTATPQTVSRE
ncbi:MAG: nuclear transport factor 2 family protein [Gemmatimonadales bacterium]|nr:nuclear transport factor 2 family protein [Gemmatimonadales bacterium]